MWFRRSNWTIALFMRHFLAVISTMSLAQWEVSRSSLLPLLWPKHPTHSHPPCFRPGQMPGVSFQIYCSDIQLPNFCSSPYPCHFFCVWPDRHLKKLLKGQISSTKMIANISSLTTCPTYLGLSLRPQLYNLLVCPSGLWGILPCFNLRETFLFPWSRKIHPLLLFLYKFH